MNNEDHVGPENWVDDDTLDCLVDGELDAASYRRVLRSLEQEPGGWKRCALSFLESQAWRAEVAPDQTPSAKQTTPLKQVTSAALGSSVGTRVGWGLAIAASWLLAFSIGMMSRVGAGPGETPDVRLAGPPSVAGPNRVAQSDNVVQQDGDSLPAAEGPKSRPVVGQLAGNSGSLGSLELRVEDALGWKSERVEVPVYAFDDDGVERLLSEQSQVPLEFVRAIERSGHRVLRTQHWIPVPLQDGDQVLVPIEQVEIVPVGQRAFQ